MTEHIIIIFTLPGMISFLNRYHRIPTATLSTGALNTGGVRKIYYFRPILLHISESVQRWRTWIS